MDRRIWALTTVIIIAMLAVFSLIWTVGCGGNNATEKQEGSALTGQTQGDETDYSSAYTETGSPGEAAQGGEAGGTGSSSSQEDDTVESAATGEDFSVTTPTQRYVSETQRHQNFLAAVASGDVRRMDFISTDFQPVDDPNSSYITFSLTLTGEARSTGLMVMKFDSGMWRLAQVKELGGSLEGGTNYLVPATFEDTLAAEIAGHQLFFTKLAEGKVSYLVVDEDQHPSDTETVLIGRVVTRSGRTENTVMYLRKDYNLWHLTGFDYR